MKPETRTQRAIRAKRDARAEKQKSVPALANFFERQTDEYMQPNRDPLICHGEVVPACASEETKMETFNIRDTLINPDSPAVDASMERTDLLQAAFALEVGIDAAASIDARNSLEKMLAHQMGVCHVQAMKLMGECTNFYGSDERQLLRLKKITTAAKLMDVYQKAMDTLAKTRNAGRQIITVKQVHVSGGQNVIADNVTPGGVAGRGD